MWAWLLVILALLGAIPGAFFLWRRARRHTAKLRRKPDIRKFRNETRKMVRKIEELAGSGVVAEKELGALAAEWRQDLNIFAGRQSLRSATPKQIEESIVIPDSLDPRSAKQWLSRVCEELGHANCFYGEHFSLSQAYCTAKGVDVLRIFDDPDRAPCLTEYLLHDITTRFALAGVRKLVVLQRKVPKANQTGFFRKLRRGLDRNCNLILINRDDLYPPHTGIPVANPDPKEDVLSCHEAPTLVVDPLPIGDGLLRKVGTYLKNAVMADLKGLAIVLAVKDVAPVGRGGVRGLPPAHTVLTLDLGAIPVGQCTPENPVPGHAAMPRPWPLF